MSIKWTGEDLHDWQLATNGARRVREWFMIGAFCVVIALVLFSTGCTAQPESVCALVARATGGYAGTVDSDVVQLLDARGNAIGNATLEQVAECVRGER
jgi:hypothetical protein